MKEKGEGDEEEEEGKYVSHNTAILGKEPSPFPQFTDQKTLEPSSPLYSVLVPESCSPLLKCLSDVLSFPSLLSIYSFTSCLENFKTYPSASCLFYCHTNITKILPLIFHSLPQELGVALLCFLDFGHKSLSRGLKAFCHLLGLYPFNLMGYYTPTTNFHPCRANFSLL